jgi:hypothetical protein
MKKIQLFSAMLLLTAFAFVGCEKEAETLPAVVESKSKILVVHASPNAPGVDLLVDGVKQNSAALSFPANTGYLSLNAGLRNVKVNVAGTSTSVIDVNSTFDKDKNYTIFAIDSVSKLSVLLLNDNLATPASGKAHIRFVHLSPNAPAVDISVKGQAAGAGLFLNRAFNKTINTAQETFIPVDAATYDLEVRVAGTATVALPLNGIKLESGKIYTVFAKGFLGVTGSSALGAEIVVNN